MNTAQLNAKFENIEKAIDRLMRATVVVGNEPRKPHPKKWRKRFLDLARLVASWSKDPTTHVGAVATDADRGVLESGYNGLPRGVLDLEFRVERPAKYLWTTHAEANLVAAAAKHRLSGSTVYVTHVCCAQCAALLINAGVAEVVAGSGDTSMPQEQFDVAMEMFMEAGVKVAFESDAEDIDQVG